VTNTLTRPEIIAWLRENDSHRLAELWQAADLVRQQQVGPEVFLRGLIELSNYCVRLCGYCGLRAPNRQLERYRMTEAEVMGCAQKAVQFGYGTVVLQAGEDPGLTHDWVLQLIRRIKAETPLAVTLSLGEREDDELVAWREAGADRYLLRFETSNRRLFESIHPPRNGETCDRLAILKKLRTLQTYEDLADDIELFATLDLDMIGVGPYLSHPETPLADPSKRLEAPAEEQVPATELMTYKVLALTRLKCPRANIPATTALATLNTANGRELGLERGANIVMPNLTPPKYRVKYEIYPGKACINETSDQCNTCLSRRIASIGREIGVGRGNSKNFASREE
jgi:biotin synthase